MNDAIKTLEFLHNSSHILHTKTPSISRHLLSQLEKKAINQNIDLESRIQKSYCHSCHTYYIPGVNCSVSISRKRIHLNKESKVLDLLTYDNGRQPHKLHNYVIYTCWVCHADSILSGSSKMDVKNMRKNLNNKSFNDHTQEPSSSTTLTQAQNTNSLQSSKKKKKKHNNEQLLNLIHSKKQKQESKGLNLNDFLSSL